MSGVPETRTSLIVTLPQRPRRVLLLGTVGAACVALFLGLWFGGVILGSGNAYAQPWCSATLGYMYGPGDLSSVSFSHFIGELRYEQSQGAPLGNLISDEKTFSTEQANAYGGAISNYLPAVPILKTDQRAVSADARAINQDCGLPATYRLGQLQVPSLGTYGETTKKTAPTGE